MTILDIQMILAERGYKPGPLDGIFGRQTASAIRKFQSDHGLEPDGIIGPVTTAALLTARGGGPFAAEAPLVWHLEAARLFGTREVAGTGSNREILKWADDAGITYKSDDIPWCGLFVAHCIGATLAQEPLPSIPLRARAWEKFGIATAPTKGAVMVFWRKSLPSGLGHVGFYAGEDDGAYCILGGNQSDSVSLAWINKKRLISARWPATVPPVVAKPVRLARGRAVESINEA